MTEIQNAAIEWLDDGTPYSRQFDDIYFSSQGGVAESNHVFLEGSNLKARWNAHRRSGGSFSLIELGFGTGLNFLLCWQLLDELSIDNFHLHYLAFEKHPLLFEDLKKAQALWPELSHYSSQLLDFSIDHTAGLHRIQVNPGLTLDLYLGDANKGLEELFDSSTTPVDCWFMDGFAPAKNPALWNDTLIRHIWQLSCSGATISTYSVAGQLRRSLETAGFSLQRLPGFGNKREMLLAVKKDENSGSYRVRTQFEKREPWFRVTVGKPDRRKAVIVGAGLAGCSSAYSLARKGWHVTLVDAGENIASGASGNRQGVLQPRLAAESSSQSLFYVHALLFAHRQLAQFQQIHDIGWHADGIIRLAGEHRAGLLKLMQSSSDFYNQKVLTTITRKHASNLAGIEMPAGALFLPHGGWLRPLALCQAYLKLIPSERLSLVMQCEITELKRKENDWQLFSGNNMVLESPVVILANSYQASEMGQTSFIPLTPVRGQLTFAKSNSKNARLKRVVVAEKYICPEDDSLYSIGASYQTRCADRASRLEDDRENLQGIQAAFADPGKLQLIIENSRASIRCKSIDYLPVVGAVPDYEDFLDAYEVLRRNASANITRPANYQPGLYINTGHGSYGLVSCPLSSEYLASLISHESLPMTTPLADSLSPARFIIRELKRQ